MAQNLLKQNKIYITKQQRNIRERQITFKIIIHGYNYLKESKNLEPTSYIYIYTHTHIHIYVTTQIQMLKLPKCQKRYIIKE